MKFDLTTENINYIKIVYKDANDFSHCLKASIKYLTEKEIYALIKIEEYLTINTPQDVELNFASDNGLYKAVSTLKYTRYEEPYLYLSLTTPENVDYAQNREYFRVKINENALISFDTENNSENISCVTEDISANGVKCICDKEVSFPPVVQITLFFQDRQVVANAKYIRTEKDGEQFKSSFSFDGLKEQDLDFISGMCLKKQLEIKRKSLL